jgi:WhiB family transcriptional regulator, redox-sensing transcriptional regulator
MTSFPGWMKEAACKDEPPETFFFMNKRGPHVKQLRAARKFCEACPVSAKCLEYALVHQVSEGVWGGVLFPEQAEAYRNVRFLRGDHG